MLLKIHHKNLIKIKAFLTKSLLQKYTLYIIAQIAANLNSFIKNFWPVNRKFKLIF